MALRTHMRELCGALFFSLSLLNAMQPAHWTMRPGYVFPPQDIDRSTSQKPYGQPPFLPISMPVQPLFMQSVPLLPYQSYAMPYLSYEQAVMIAMQQNQRMLQFLPAITASGALPVSDTLFSRIQETINVLKNNTALPSDSMTAVCGKLYDVARFFNVLTDDSATQENIDALRSCISLLSNDLAIIEMYGCSREEKQLFAALKTSIDDSFKERFGVSCCCQVVEMNEKERSEEWVICSSSSASSSVQTPDSESVTPRPWTPLNSPRLLEQHFFEELHKEDLRKSAASSQQASRTATPIQPIPQSASAPLSRASSCVKLTLLKRSKSKGKSMAIYSLPTSEPAERYPGYFTGEGV